MADDHTLRQLPIELVEAINRTVRASRQLLHETGREPTPLELADRMGSPVEEVRKWLKMIKEPMA